MKNEVQIHIDSSNRINPEGIDLTYSFILNWKKKDLGFEIELDLSIWSSSPYYSVPNKNEYTCYKKGYLRFFGINDLKGYVDLESVNPSIDSDGIKDWDCIYEFRKEDGRIKFETEFTEIEIICDGFEITIEE
jgi:hypothetical protein